MAAIARHPDNGRHDRDAARVATTRGDIADESKPDVAMNERLAKIGRYLESVRATGDVQRDPQR